MSLGPSGYPQGRVAESFSPADLIGRASGFLAVTAGCQAHGSGVDSRTNYRCRGALTIGHRRVDVPAEYTRGYTRSTSVAEPAGVTRGLVQRRRPRRCPGLRTPRPIPGIHRTGSSGVMSSTTSPMSAYQRRLRNAVCPGIRFRHHRSWRRAPRPTHLAFDSIVWDQSTIGGTESPDDTAISHAVVRPDIGLVVGRHDPDEPGAVKPGMGRGVEVRGHAEAVVVDEPLSTQLVQPDVLRVYPRRVLSWHTTLRCPM